MNELQVLRFESAPVRVLDSDGEPWWVAADVCGILGLDNPSMAVGRLDDDERGISSIDTPSGTQEMLVINESGLYSLILTSRKPEAKAFKKWVTSEVLPTLRKTGHYSIQQDEDPLVAQARLQLELAQRQVELERALQEQQRQLEELKVQTGLASTHLTFRGFCSKLGLHLSRSESIGAGKSVAKRCREKGLEVQKITDVRYGYVNAYPVEVLSEWLNLYRQTVG